jgi:hypothetical protein
MTARLDWYGCATFRLTVGSLVIFLDAYIDRTPEAAGTGLRADDIERADWIVVGHSHFDHLYWLHGYPCVKTAFDKRRDRCQTGSDRTSFPHCLLSGEEEGMMGRKADKHLPPNACNHLPQCC